MLIPTSKIEQGQSKATLIISLSITLDCSKSVMYDDVTNQRKSSHLSQEKKGANLQTPNTPFIISLPNLRQRSAVSATFSTFKEHNDDDD